MIPNEIGRFLQTFKIVKSQTTYITKKMQRSTGDEIVILTRSYVFDEFMKRSGKKVDSYDIIR